MGFITRTIGFIVVSTCMGVGAVTILNKVLRWRHDSLVSQGSNSVHR